jgi:dipeptidyl aminopeptidase/acylaminoacyl peptidase
MKNEGHPMMHLLRLLLWLAAIVCGSATAQTAALTAERMWDLQRLGTPAISMDGRLAVVPVTHYDIAENKGLTDLWLVSVVGAGARQLTIDAASDTHPVFSPDGKSIAFISKRGEDKQPQVYVIPVDGGEARRVTNVPTGADLPKWFPDSRHVAFMSAVWSDIVRWQDQAKRLQERDESKMTARAWDRAPIAYWDHFIDDREPQLFSIDVGGGEPIAITRGAGYSLSKADTDEFSYDISPDGLEIAFVANVDRSGIDPNHDVLVIPACGCKPVVNVTVGSLADDDDPRYSPDGRYLAFTRQRIKHFYGDRARLMLHSRSGGGTTNLTESWDRSVSEPSWLADSRALVASIDDAGTRRMYRIDVRGAPPKAITTTPSFSALALSSGAAVAIRQSFSEPPTLVRLDVRSAKVEALTHLNDAALHAIELGKVESVTYSGAKGEPIQMWVVYPPGFDPAKKYPVFMLLHGGPHNAMTDGTQWRWNAQVFAAWGYIVTWHNFHGSSGFGQAFADSINPDWISLPYEDTIKATQWLEAQPYVDRERLAAGGGSYGGFLAATLLGREHPFKALIVHAGVYNQYTQIGADYGAEKPRFNYFWEKPDDFVRYSPHTNAANFKTPTLVMHGQMDMRVPVNHGVELFNILQSRGVPSRLVYFPDENHWVLKPQNSLFWYRNVREWLAQYAPPGGR